MSTTTLYTTEALVKLSVHPPGVEQATADRLVQTTHQVCPYSNAARGNIDVTLEATV
ncbi:OsmC family protein [Streptomyces mirabilis]|uniref:hypothetical protein n=1 Tax=Streptomyces mirabilis TaxID=68239 RepID=UPI0028F6EFE1|nr:hypothetical protein [Streptomyces mirabilis]